MNLSYLESFYYVAKFQSFTKAAYSLDISKSVLSKHVKHLENDLSTQLLLRTTRSVSLTESGQGLYEKCLQIFKLTDEAQKYVSDLTQQDFGNLLFSCSTSLGETLSAKLVDSFRREMPLVNLDINLKNEFVDILHGEYDIALRASDDLHDDLVAKYLGQIKDVIVASPILIKEVGAISIPQDLYDKPCLLNSHKTQWNNWLFTDTTGESINVLVNGQIAANQYTLQRNFALRGLGIAKLPLYAVENEIKSGQLVQLLEKYQIATHPLYIVHAKRNPLPRKVKVFKQLIWQWSQKYNHYFVK